MTMPAMAPPLNPLLLVVDDKAAPALVAAADMIGTVVVAEPVDETVVTALLVGRKGAVLVAGAVVMICPR